MTRFQSLTIYAIMIIIIGMLVVFMSIKPYEEIQYIVSLGIILTGIFAGITAYKCKYLNVPYSYHLAHAFGFIIYGLVILSFGHTSPKFLMYTSFFLLYYGITEMIFTFQVTMLERSNVNYKILIARLVIGVLIGVGSFIILILTSNSRWEALNAAGIVFVFCGVNLLLFRTILKNLVVPI